MFKGRPEPGAPCCRRQSKDMHAYEADCERVAVVGLAIVVWSVVREEDLPRIETL